MKEDLRHYLRDARASMLWKLDDLGERDIRRPLTRTGTNLLGLVKHLTTVESLYFGIVFDRPPTNPVPWLRPDLEPNSDLWATADESRDYIVGAYQEACRHADATIEELDLDAVGTVVWWPEQRATLHRVLAHVVAETQRHLGHADIVRELIDGAVGLRRGEDFMAPRDEQWWQARLTRLEAVADNA
ncbi:DinB family protein [Kutzneria kofuensis]|uniref:Putative damage-inducible protein DinB n=1 Tax=Kutzneria kofuensis TaxID=103725 RepID=A0A7W9NDD5_9PSEU|nr:DinB family protein [Kutzneria kofuensis]MBB5889147.1 putative damage-inducible protein DinB [Kutzneria kofuensis]